MNVVNARQATGMPRVLQLLQDSFWASSAMADSLPVAICVCDADGAIVQFNGRAADIWGYRPDLSREPVRHGAARQIFRADGRPLDRTEWPMAEVLRTGVAIRDQTFVLERPDGRRVAVLSNIHPVRDDAGAIVGAIHCFEDVTDLREMRSDLDRCRKDLDDFFETGAVALHVVTSDGTILRANQAELDLLGYSHDEYVGRSIRDIHADRKDAEDILARLWRGERLDRRPARLRARDGSLRDVLITSNAQSRHGKFVATRCFTVDVTELKRTREALTEREQRLAATYDNVSIGIAEADATGQIVRVNEAICAITGFPREELLGETLFNRTHPDDIARDRLNYRQQAAGGYGHYVIEKRFVKKDGSVIWISVSSSSVCDERGNFLYGVRVVQDVTERKLAEERQQTLVDELNHRVKNVIATVQSLAAHTLRDGEVPDAARRSFDERLRALACVHDQLTGSSWQSADLAAMIEDIFAPYRSGACAVRLDGAGLRLRPQAAVTLALVLHELATNAVKYGSLSVGGGSLDVAWRVAGSGEDAALCIDWSESGGPRVASPERRGFGSRLLDWGVVRELQGAVDAQFEPSGFRCRIEVPIGAVRG